ncbi:hypothetical protein PIECOFPK_00751 [Mycovorax composti]|jgi:Protein of unknown function (DUF3127).|uniref:DUF3127 domain-containing protein n=2 Tax=Chitinophagaceae TaxID=563835 RepID=A0ABZ2EHX8_9BACT
MELTGKLIQVLPLQSGVAKTGNEWRKQDIIVETEGQYPKKVCISIWGDRINDKILQVGNMLKIYFDIESREFNGRWYTDVKAWKVEPLSSSGDDGGYIDEMPSDMQYDDIKDDLPF